MAEKKEIIIDKDKCIGCGTCVGIADEYFELDKDGKSEVINQYDEKDKEVIEDAIKNCPVEAITLK